MTMRYYQHTAHLPLYTGRRAPTVRIVELILFPKEPNNVLDEFIYAHKCLETREVLPIRKFENRLV